MADTDSAPSPSPRSGRGFARWDLSVHPDDDPRTDGGFAGERDTPVGHLRVIGEYARHDGHADFLRERTDGSAGQ